MRFDQPCGPAKVKKIVPTKPHASRHGLLAELFDKLNLLVKQVN